MKQLIYILSILILAGCQSNLTDPPGHFSQLVDLQPLSLNGQQFLMILDQGKNQLFFYDTREECYFDNDLNLPGENGVVVPELPYKIVISPDQQKGVILSANALSIINLDPLDPLSKNYQKGCTQTVLPYKEAQYPLEKQPDTFFVRKGGNYDYHLYLIYNRSGEVVELLYKEETFTTVNTTTYPGEITAAYDDGENLLITVAGEERIYIDGVDNPVTLGDTLTAPYFTKLVTTDQYFILYDQQGQQLLIWDRNSSNYISIPGTVDPLTPEQPKKGYPLRYPLYDMKLFTNSLPGENPFNGQGYPETYQLLGGDYLMITDTSGYLYFISLNHSTEELSAFPEGDFETEAAYKTALENRYRPFNIPLYNDYLPEVSYLSQEQTCTQFNRQEANGCFNVVDDDAEYTNQQYVKLDSGVTDGTYHLKGEQFRFIYNGVIPGYTGTDGSITGGVFQSSSTDFSPLESRKDQLSLELPGKLSAEKESDHNCVQYVAGEPIVLNIKAMSGHAITPDLTGHPDLESCFDQALTFQIRGKDSYILTGSISGYIDIVTPCTHNQEENPDRPLCDENRETYRYQNDLFTVELFSDNTEPEVDSKISFYLSGTRYQMRFNYALVAPGRAFPLYQTDGNHHIYIMDYHKNQIYKVESRYLNRVEDILQ